MRRAFLLILAVVFVAGCGQPEKAKPAKGKGQASIEKNHLAEAIQYLKEADPNSAIRSFDQAIKQDPLNPQGYLLLGQVYMHMQNYARAIDTFAAAVRVAPEDGDGYYFLAMCHGLSGNMDFAVKNAQRSAELFRLSKEEDKFMRSLALVQGLMQSQANPEETEEK